MSYEYIGKVLEKSFEHAFKNFRQVDLRVKRQKNYITSNIQNDMNHRV